MISQRQLFLQHVAQTSEAPLMLEIVEASGISLTDINGKKYTDLISGISVSNLGHHHPKIVQAIKDQADQYIHLMVYGEYVQSPQVRLATLLAKQTPAIDSYFFVNSGTEAIEGCIKLARRYTKRKKIIACRNAYHGSSMGTLSLCSNEDFTRPFQPLLDNIEFIDFNDLSELNKINTETACVFVEIVQGEAGAINGNKDFLAALRTQCTASGALLIVDEIQTGFGRTGSLFAFMQHSLQPDIIAIAKGMGGGMPIGAFGAPNHIMQALSHDPALGHITTFGGNAICCSAGIATLETLLNSDLISSVPEKEMLVRNKLTHPSIKSITGKGLLLGVQFESIELNQRIISKCISNGIITDWFLFAPDKMRITPPLIISNNELEIACNIILKSIDEVLSFKYN